MANSLVFKDQMVRIGDIIRVHWLTKEAEKEKTLVFEGRLIGLKGRSPNKTIMVRRMAANNVGVERIFPLSSPLLAKIEVKKSMPAKRAKLYYLRTKI